MVHALRGEPITIHGDGEQTRSFCYVSDLIDGLVRLMNTSHDVTGPVNLGNTAEVTIRELADTVLRLTGSKSKIVRAEPLQDDPRRRRPDITRAGSILGWTPTTPLEAGLRKTIAYFDQLMQAGAA